MIRCEVIENFTLKDFKKLKNIIRKGKDLEGHLYKEDVFECDEEMAKYLTGGNDKDKTVVKILEVIPKEKTIQNASINFFEEEKEPNAEIKLEEKPKKKKNSKKKKED